MTKKKLTLEILLIIGLLAIDLLSKQLVFAFMKDQPVNNFVVLKGVFEFTLVYNDGASFGIFSGQQTLLIVITAFAMIAILIFLYMRPNTPKLFRLGMLLIFAGGLGNLVDRIAFKYVRDFIKYTFLETILNAPFAIGNIADIFCCVGVVAIVVYLLFEFDEKDFMSKKKLAQLETVGDIEKNANYTIELDDSNQPMQDSILHNDNNNQDSAEDNNANRKL